MARGTPAYFEGEVASSRTTTVVQDLYNAVVTSLASYQSNSQDAWEEIDTVNATAGSEDRVFQSKGDRTLVSGAGDANLILRVQQISTDDIRFTAYQDWSDVSSTGSNAAGDTSATWLNLNTVSGFRYWGMVNEYEFVFLARQDNLFHYFHCGSPIRSHVPAGADGIAFTTASAAAGSSVTVTLDRDITSAIRDSTASGGAQQVWIYNVTPAATALRSATIELATVDTIATGSITFASLSNSFDSGAIVGLDPSGMFVCEDESVAPGGSLDIAQYWTNSLSGTYSAVSTQSGDYENFLAGTGTPSASPTTNGIITGARFGLFMDQVSNTGFRGVSELVAHTRSGFALDGDFFRPDYSTANQYKIFPSLIFAVNGPAFMIGPGAS